ncbi:hypothetical protein DL93DRAFT_2232175 [Clavulina sp. PMI_390]|nr:hypothetical protein DL93DRAFT_2232175 [Clavulina sp. PMI_390]
MTLTLALPLEIISLILRFCDRKSLKAVTLSSGSLKDEADRHLWNHFNPQFDDGFSTSPLPPYLPPERARHMKSVFVTFICEQPHGGLIAAFQLRQIMDNIVNAAHNVTTLTVYLRVNETENSSPPFRHFALGVLHDLIYHSRPHVTSLGLWFLQTHGMVLHAPDLEALYSNHPRLERLIVEIPVSDDVTAQGCDALRNSHLKCLEVSDVTHLYLARGCCLTQLSIVLKLPAPTTEMFFASIESSLQSSLKGLPQNILILTWREKASSALRSTRSDDLG